MLGKFSSVGAVVNKLRKQEVRAAAQHMHHAAC
jgi:hypothetical protein